jgi:membrane associated rhomboid family serine protease
MHRNAARPPHAIHHQQRQMRQSTQSWFQGCPLSKFIALSTVITHVILEKGGFSGGTDLLSLNLDDITTHGEVYRLFLNTLTFSTVGELVLGLMVLAPLMVQFEREMGTKKFGSFLLVKCLLLSTMLQVLCLMILDRFSFNGEYSFFFATGPYPFIGSLFYLYHAYTPRLHTKFIGILGFDFSDKVTKYASVFIMVWSQGLLSLIPTICGFIASMISISPKNVYGRWECVLPKFVHSIAENIGRVFGLDTLVTSSVYINNNGNTGIRRRATNNPGRRGGGGGLGGGAAAPPPPPQFQPMPTPQPPSAEAIEQLTSMGFERDAVVRALGATDNNVEAAANRLLTSI